MKKYLITGLLVWVPLGITIWVLNLTIGTMDQTLLLLPEHWHPDEVLGIHIPGLGIILTFAVVLLTGLLIRNVFGQRLWEYSEKAMLHVPFVGSIYKGVKQVSDTLLTGSGNLPIIISCLPIGYMICLRNGTYCLVIREILQEHVSHIGSSGVEMHYTAGIYQQEAGAIRVNTQVDAAALELVLASVMIKTRLREITRVF